VSGAKNQALNVIGPYRNKYRVLSGTKQTRKSHKLTGRNKC